METVPRLMHAVHLIGHGGPDRLQYREDVPVPVPAEDEVLVRVGAAGVNNTDINTRIGWYSKRVTTSTNAGGEGYDDDLSDDGSWDGQGIGFPRVQGADVAGRIVTVGQAVAQTRLGERVLVRPMQTPDPNDPTRCVTLGSELDGGFAQFVAVPSIEAFRVNSPLTDVELASFPCAYSTAEGVLERTAVAAGDRVIITGASGGVGSAAVQLAKLRGAEVVAVASRAKWDSLRAIGADRLIGRDEDLVAELGTESIDVVIDVVAGEQWPSFLEILRRGGRYGTSGAIAGPIVSLDVRTLYLKDLTLVGSTCQPRSVFENLVGFLENDQLVPLVAGTYPLRDIVTAQADFLAKGFTGKLVLVPPG